MLNEDFGYTFVLGNWRGTSFVVSNPLEHLLLTSFALIRS